ncbi:MAG: hypothetical protein ACT4P2_08875 [Pseudomonadota bacterium]
MRGLIVMVPPAPPARQRALFRAALDHVGSPGDLVGKVLEITARGALAVLREYDWP